MKQLDTGFYSYSQLSTSRDDDLIIIMLRTCACRSFMSCSKPRIAIIGAGVIGLTVGVCLTARSRLEKVISGFKSI